MPIQTYDYISKHTFLTDYKFNACLRMDVIQQVLTETELPGFAEFIAGETLFVGTIFMWILLKNEWCFTFQAVKWPYMLWECIEIICQNINETTLICCTYLGP